MVTIVASMDDLTRGDQGMSRRLVVLMAIACDAAVGNLYDARAELARHSGAQFAP